MKTISQHAKIPLDVGVPTSELIPQARPEHLEIIARHMFIQAIVTNATIVQAWAYRENLQLAPIPIAQLAAWVEIFTVFLQFFFCIFQDLWRFLQAVSKYRKRMQENNE